MYIYKHEQIYFACVQFESESNSNMRKLHSPYEFIAQYRSVNVYFRMTINPFIAGLYTSNIS